MRLQQLRRIWGLPKASHMAGLLAGVALAAIAPVAGNGLLQNSGSHVPSAVSRMTSSTDQASRQPSQAEQRNFLAADAERRKQIVDDSAALLKLATDLKTAVDKSNKDTLSLTVIRKAEAIEKLARGVKEKMKLTGRAG